MTTGRRARAVLVGLAACAALGLVGCSDSGYEYVSNGEAGLYFRVPDGWSIIEIDDAETGMPEPVGSVDSWLRLLDRSPTPSPDNFNAALPLYPVGLANVTPILSLDARDELDYAGLRAMATNGTDDPVALADMPDSGFEMVSRRDVTTDEGLRGERIIFNVSQDDGSTLTVDQTALVDPLTTELYQLLLKCEAHCYESNRSEIDDIADSWTIDRED